MGTELFIQYTLCLSFISLETLPSPLFGWHSVVQLICSLHSIHKEDDGRVRALPPIVGRRNVEKCARLPWNKLLTGWCLVQMSEHDQNINELPDEVLEFIFSHMPPYKDLESCALVCKRWTNIVRSEYSLGWHTSVLRSAPNFLIGSMARCVCVCIHDFDIVLVVYCVHF